MTHEERLEVFENYKEYAEYISVINRGSIERETAKAIGLRCLWEATAHHRNLKIKKRFLDGAIKAGILKEVLNTESRHQVGQYVKLKKGEITPKQCCNGEIASRYEHGRPALIDLVPEPACVDEPNAVFEVLPDNFSDEMKKDITMLMNGHDFDEIAKRDGVCREAVRKRIRKYARRKNWTTIRKEITA